MSLLSHTLAIKHHSWAHGSGPLLICKKLVTEFVQGGQLQWWPSAIHILITDHVWTHWPVQQHVDAREPDRHQQQARVRSMQQK